MKRTAAFQTNEVPSSTKQTTESLEYPNIPIDGEGLLSSLIYPLDTKTFMNDYWTKQVRATSINDPQRVKDLLDRPFPFHLKTLLELPRRDCLRKDSYLDAIKKEQERFDLIHC